MKYAKWIKDTVYSIDPGREVLIKEGEIRRIKLKSDDGKFILEGKNGPGSSFGWVEPEEIEIVD